MHAHLETVGRIVVCNVAEFRRRQNQKLESFDRQDVESERRTVACSANIGALGRLRVAEYRARQFNLCQTNSRAPVIGMMTQESPAPSALQLLRVETLAESKKRQRLDSRQGHDAVIVP